MNLEQPGVTPMKPGSATFPFFGVQPVLLDEGGKEIVGEGEGALAFSKPWPGIMRTVYNDHPRFETTYFSRYPGYYFTGDGECVRGKDRVTLEQELIVVYQFQVLDGTKTVICGSPVESMTC